MKSCRTAFHSDTKSAIRRDMFGDACHCDLAFHGDAPAGIVTWFWTYKSFRAARGLFVEDLYVKPAVSRAGRWDGGCWRIWRPGAAGGRLSGMAGAGLEQRRPSNSTKAWARAGGRNGSPIAWKAKRWRNCHERDRSGGGDRRQWRHRQGWRHSLAHLRGPEALQGADHGPHRGDGPQDLGLAAAESRCRAGSMWW